jgi:hypothetical protein
MSRCRRFPLPRGDLDLGVLGAHHVVVEGSPERRLRTRVVSIDNDLGEPAPHEDLTAWASSSGVLAAFCHTRAANTARTIVVLGR